MTVDLAASPVPEGKPRRYRGVTPEERQAARRERLLDAGLELFGTVGYQETSIKDICRAAGLNQRYFYESFDTRESLLEAVYSRMIEQISSEAIKAIVAARGLENKARAGLTVLWRAFAGDVRQGRIVALEMVGVSARLEERRRKVRQMFADILVTHSLAAAGRQDASELYIDVQLASRGLFGALVELLAAYVHNDVDATVDDLVEHCTHMFVRTAAIALHGPDATGGAGGSVLDRLSELERENGALREASGRFARAAAAQAPAASG